MSCQRPSMIADTTPSVPLGASRAHLIDVRFIAATNQDLEPLVMQNRFRKDLYYRFNVARIPLVPLRERKEDIPDLFAHFLAQYNTHYRFQVPGPDAELTQRLLQYDWPGNVRELRNLVEAVFIDPPSNPIAFSDLPESFQQIFSGYESTVSGERERLIAVLAATHWNKSQAAAELHWSRMTLYRKLAKYQLQDQGR